MIVAVTKLNPAAVKLKKKAVRMRSPFIIFSSPAVEESSSSCSDEPVAVGETPDEDTTLFVLPYEQITFRAQYMFREERFVTFLPLSSPQFQTELRITVLWVAGPAFVVCFF